MTGARLDGMDDLVALGVACENCGRKRRLAKSHIVRMIGTGINTVEQLGQKLKCRSCAERGVMSKNITITPYYRCDIAANVKAL